MTLAAVFSHRMALSRLASQSEIKDDESGEEHSVNSSRSPSPTRGSMAMSGTLTPTQNSSSVADLAVRVGLFGGKNSNSITATGVLRPPYVHARLLLLATRAREKRVRSCACLCLCA